MIVCGNCDHEYEREDELKHVFPDIPDLLQRLDVGGTVPAGECPECGALAYTQDEPVRVLILLDGGLVQDVLADRPGIEAVVLDQDLEGVDESEIVRVVGEGDTLRGTLDARGVTVAPAIIESAWRSLDDTKPCVPTA